MLEVADIIVANSQQWDVISRRWRTRKGFNLIKLFVCDDLHLIGEFGSVLEVIVSRMRLISAQNPMRIVGLALSCADYREMSEWIGAPLSFNFSP
jgi:pre-mRNA-splicing helicase BRR2